MGAEQGKPQATRVERFLAHLDHLSGGIEPEFYPIPTTHKDLHGLTVITYRDLPEPGYLTAITYGLSLAEHPERRLGKPELCLSVKSQDVTWARAIGFIAERLRDDCPFSYGDTVGFGDQMSAESEMTAFVIFAPAVLDRSDYAGVEVGDDLPINIAGAYPIYQGEREYIQKHGLEAFWKLDWDPADVHREAVA